MIVKRKRTFPSASAKLKKKRFWLPENCILLGSTNEIKPSTKLGIEWYVKTWIEEVDLIEKNLANSLSVVSCLWNGPMQSL